MTQLQSQLKNVRISLVLELGAAQKADNTVYYYTYLHLGVQGLQALGFYNAEEETWGEPHRQVNSKLDFL